MTQPFLPSLPYDPPKPPILYVYRVSWGATLILACLALGLSAGAVQIERDQVDTVRSELAAASAATSVLESRQEDLGKFFADPETHLVPLQAADASVVGHATVAWNERLEQLAVFCDRLPIAASGQPYAVLSYCDTSPQARQIGNLAVRPGVSVYFFNNAWLTHTVRRIEVTSSTVPSGHPMLYATVRG